MEFDIGNIFYIVITIVAVIVGLLGKKKKPGRTGTGGTESQTRPGFLENLEKAFNMGQPDPVMQDFQEFEEEPQEEDWKEDLKPSTSSEPMSLMEEYELLMANRPEYQQTVTMLTQSDTVTAPLELIYLDEEEGPDYIEALKHFDAGLAVVYSAIIDPLDY